MRAPTPPRSPITAWCAGASTKAGGCWAFASPGTSATSRWARSRRCSGSPFARYDPQRLVGDKEDLGITCALIPTSHRGVEIGRRHIPLNAVFQNGPNWGRDVFIPMDWVIGGQPMLGKGWRMLMECLAAGRGISLPASNTGMAKLAVRAVGAYARVRQQFKTPIGRFEGVEEALTRMGGNLYLMDAARMLTAGRGGLRREAGGRLGHRQVPPHRTRPAGHQRRHGRDRRQGNLHGSVELPRQRVHAAPGGHHRRRREHPDAQPDHLRPGRHPLPSVRAEGDRRDARAGPHEGVGAISMRRSSATSASSSPISRARW